jgi:hypothetical protein
MLKIRNVAPVLALVLLTSSLAAQERRQGGPAPYDPSKEVTVSGVVKGMESIEVPDGKRAILVLTVNNENVGILLGPEPWVQKQGVTFAPGAKVEVVGLTGFRFNGGSAVMPRTVKVGTKILTVRDATGKPLWEQ